MSRDNLLDTLRDQRIASAQPDMRLRDLDRRIVQANLAATDKKLRSLLKNEPDANRRHELSKALTRYENACRNVLDALK